jgi:hypothetical protein
MPETTPQPAASPPGASATPLAGAGALHLVLFGMPAAGKSSLLGALARAAESQEHVLGGKLVDPTHHLDELEKQVYESTMRRTADELVPYAVHFEPVGGSPSTPGPVDAVLMDCDGRVANDLLVRRASLAEDSPEGTLAHEVLEADTLILVIDASAPPAQVEADFTEFARFLRTMERGRKARSEVAGLPIFLVLTKCDLLARPSDSPMDWIDRIEQRKRDVDAHFRQFLARQGAGGKPEAPAKDTSKPDAPARDESDNGDESSDGRRVESPFGSIDLHIWATAIKRPALAGSPAKPREPYGVAELFRQCLREAADYRARARRSARRLWLLAGGAGAAVVGMLALTVVLWLGSQSSRASLLASRVEDLRLLDGGSPAQRLRGSLPELRDKLARYQTIQADPQFPSLSADLRAFVNERIDELKSYTDYLEKLQKERPLVAETTEEGLERRLARLKSDLALPRAEWQDTRAGEWYKERLDSTEALLEAVRRARNWYNGASEQATGLWAFARESGVVGESGIDWAEWTARVQKLLDPKETRLDFNEADPIPGAPALSYATALRFDKVVEARAAWQADRTRLARLLDICSALGLATGSKKPALLVFPRSFTLAQTRTRAAELKESYPDAQKTFTVEALPEAIVPRVRQVAGNQYRSLLEPGRAEVLRQLRLAGRGTIESLAKWRTVRSWLRDPPELASWRFLAGILLRLHKRDRDVKDPVEELADFLTQNKFVLQPRSLVLELPETSGLRPRAGARLAILHPDSGKQPALAFELSGEPQVDRGRRLRLYTFRLTRGDLIKFTPGDNLWAELPLAGGERRLVWSQARSSLYLFERLRNPPRVQSVSAKSLEDGSLVTGAGLVIRPDDSVPRVPDLLPNVPGEERGNP